MIVFFWICSLLVPPSIHESTLVQIRSRFYAAVNNKDEASRLYNDLRGRSHQEAIVQAYYGASQALMARYSWNPYRKVAFLKGGLQDLHRAIEKSPSNPELRFLRFSIEYHLPSFLGMSSHMDEDRKTMVELIGRSHFGTADRTLVKNMIGFFKKTEAFSAAEINILTKSIANE